MRSSFYIIKAVTNALFEPEERRLSRAQDVLCDANQEAHKKTLDGFMFQGKAFRHSTIPPGGRNFVTLHLSLWDDMTEHRRDIDRIENDKRRIEQLLFRLIEPCFNNQHVRDAIPDCIADLLPEPYCHMERMGSPIGSINEERVLREYNKLLPKIEEYAATRLLY